MAWFVVGCADVDDEARLAEAEVRDSMPTQEFDDVEMVQTKNGEIQFVLHAPRLERYDKMDRALFYGGIDVQFYEKGRVTSTLTADRGEVLDGGDDLLAIGNVVVVSDTGSTILTPRLRWSREEAEITSDTVVTIITDLDTLYGTGLIASEDLKYRKVLHPTGVTYRSKSLSDSTLETDAAAVDSTEILTAEVVSDSSATDSITAASPEMVVDTLSSNGTDSLKVQDLEGSR